MLMNSIHSVKMSGIVKIGRLEGKLEKNIRKVKYIFQRPHSYNLLIMYN